jgi:hypothetical protein
MLQADARDVRFSFYAAIAFLLQDGHSLREPHGYDRRPAVWLGIANSRDSFRTQITAIV